MAYNPSQLSAVAYNNGFTHWHYRTPDDWIAVAVEPGYFDDAAILLRRGDRIDINANIEDDFCSFSAFVTDSSSGGRIEIVQIAPPVRATRLPAEAA